MEEEWLDDVNAECITYSPSELAANSETPSCSKTCTPDEDCTDSTSSAFLDACIAFVGSMLKEIKNKALQLETMQKLVDTVIEA